MIEQHSNWFWDTPEGGGWFCWLSSGDCVDRHALSRLIDGAEGAQLVEFQRILVSYPGRDPTATERRAWQTINPTADGQEPEGDDE